MTAPLLGSRGQPFPQKGDEDTGAAFVMDPTMAAAFGTPADEPWDGTGDATVISLLKKIALNTDA